MSRRFIFGSSAIRVRARERSLLLSDLSYSSGLALTLMRARMISKSAHAHTRVAEIPK